MTVNAIPAIAPIASAWSTGSTTAAPSVGTGSGADFAGELGKGLDAVTDAQSKADNLAVQAATGVAVDPAAYTIAATQATLMTQLAATVQSKAVTAFNTIMGMQA
jgi:flagellar hook-basal body complex protein FliE